MHKIIMIFPIPLSVPPQGIENSSIFLSAEKELIHVLSNTCNWDTNPQGASEVAESPSTCIAI